VTSSECGRKRSPTSGADNLHFQTQTSYFKNGLMDMSFKNGQEDKPRRHCPTKTYFPSPLISSPGSGSKLDHFDNKEKIVIANKLD